MKLLFLHGLESGPHGSKYQALRWMFGEVLAPDCSGVRDAGRRLEIILGEVDREREPLLVVGSSMGGLMAMLLQKARPDKVAGMVLCAPALHRPEAGEIDYHHLPPTRVIHGRHDTVVPLSASLPFGDRLTVVDDDHRLAGSTEQILRAVFDVKLILAQEAGFGLPTNNPAG